MNFLKKLFSSKDKPKPQKPQDSTIEEFWLWFERSQEQFYQALKNNDHVDFNFINPVVAKLSSIQKGAYLLTGMFDENTAELIFTAECNIKNFNYIEEIVRKAPSSEKWKFTAFKPPVKGKPFSIDLGSKKFTQDNIKFYPIEESAFPDDIVIRMVYLEEFQAKEKEWVENGCYHFLEYYLGEVCTATQIDEIRLDPGCKDHSKLIDIIKLKDYINWREKEFIEQYDDTFYFSEESNFNAMEWTKDDRHIIGICNNDLLEWESKASHPWIFVINVKFNDKSINGMPEENLLKSISDFEALLRGDLKDSNGCLHVGQTTGDGERNSYFACKEFKRPVEVLNDHMEKTNFRYSYVVFKDKYWRSLGLFTNYEM